MSQSALRRPGRRPSSVDAAQWQYATVGVAFLVLVLLGARQELSHTVTVGYVAALVIAPLWLGALGKFRGAASLFVVGIACCLSGFWLLALNSPDHQVDASTAINNVTLVVGLLLTVGTVLWAKQVMPEWLVGLSYGLGMLLGVSRSGAVAENAWKFGYSLPVIVISLSIVYSIGRQSRTRQRIVEVVVLSLLGAFSALNDGRSLFAMLGMTAVLVLWQLVPPGRTGRRSVVKTILALAGVAIATYEVMSSLLVDGYLGAAAQERSAAQLNLAGSLILGGRPEMVATLALFEHNPLGFGLGIIPSPTDISVAKTGMASINYQPDNGYVERYMFGSQFEVHSVIGDLWALFGIPGVILSGALIVWAARSIAVGVTYRRAGALHLFLASVLLWNVFFGPLLTSVAIIGIGMGLMLPNKSRDETVGAARSPWRRNQMGRRTEHHENVHQGHCEGIETGSIVRNRLQPASGWKRQPDV